jgi:hypothetical protein
MDVSNHPDEGEIVICCGGAKPSDAHLASKIVAINEEIIEWLGYRERRKRDRLARTPPAWG